MPLRYEIVTAWPTDDVVALYESAGWWRESATGRAAVGPMIAGSFAFLVVTDGERAIGMGRAISDGVSDAYIQDVVVLPSHRGRGHRRRDRPAARRATARSAGSSGSGSWPSRARPRSTSGSASAR